MTRFVKPVTYRSNYELCGKFTLYKGVGKKEYLYDLEKGFDEEPVEGVLVAVKSMQGRALMFEVYLPEYGVVMISFIYQHCCGKRF